ncbi:hypothetical protein JCGZ_05104 [Jatropha curcas]|uniref:Uncharacterized protein n=1 Tax=Jatropha curcas TaxID=180498 RepID=A0A067LFA9_JATCU|nr:hypothetical protein JCGZ_05104 [Jatropha curcas]
MGNCIVSCKPRIIGYKDSVLRVVKMDRKILKLSSPILVKDLLANFSWGSNIGLSKEAKEQLPLDYELKLGHIYYILPSLTKIVAPSLSMTDKDEAGEVKRIKVVIAKQQLEQLLTKKVSIEEVLLRIERKSFLDSSTSWKPKLESILERYE